MGVGYNRIGTEYSTVLGSFVYYSATNGANIYRIAAPSPGRWSDLVGSPWIWSRLDARDHRLDQIADSAARSGFRVNRSQTFGRFRVADYDGGVTLVILVRHVDTPVYVAKVS